MSFRLFAPMLTLCMLVLFTGLAGCEKKVTEANFNKITNGMSLAQVEKILGSGTDDTPAAGFSVSGAGVGSQTAHPEKIYVWKTPEMTITVIFKDGNVIQKSKT
jgi:hypothetical protein